MSAVFLKLFNLSIEASWLVLAVLALRFLLGRTRTPKYVLMLMWALVGVRLALPFSVESALSLLPSREVITMDTVQFSPAPTVSTGVPFFDSAVNPGFSQAFTPEPGANVNPLHVWTTAAGWVWLAGVLAMVGYFAVSALVLKRRVRTCSEAEKGVRESPAVPSPFVFGFLRPVIYLPAGMDPTNRLFVLAHERAHIRRRDYLIKPLAFLLLAVYWFNPVLWLAYVLLCRDIELACDEKVLSELGVQAKRPYSEALLSAVTFHRHVAACPVAFGEGKLTKRVKNVLSWKKPVLWITLTSLVLCAVLAVCFLTDPKGPAAGPSDNPEAPTTPPSSDPTDAPSEPTDDPNEPGADPVIDFGDDYDGLFDWVLQSDGEASPAALEALTQAYDRDHDRFLGTLGMREESEALSLACRLVLAKPWEEIDAFRAEIEAYGPLSSFVGRGAMYVSMMLQDYSKINPIGALLNDPAGIYVFNSTGSALDNRTIRLNSDGSFNYDGGILASTATLGTWTLEDGIITLTEAPPPPPDTVWEPREYRLQVTPGGLVYLAHESADFMYANDLYEGALFRRAVIGDVDWNGSFSWAAASATYLPGDPGVKTEGFVNTSQRAAAVLTPADAVIRALSEVTVEYNEVWVFYDRDAGMYHISFGLKGIPGGDESVYLDVDGVTRLIVYGE